MRKFGIGRMQAPAAEAEPKKDVVFKKLIPGAFAVSAAAVGYFVFSIVGDQVTSDLRARAELTETCSQQMQGVLGVLTEQQAPGRDGVFSYTLDIDTITRDNQDGSRVGKIDEECITSGVLLGKSIVNTRTISGELTSIAGVVQPEAATQMIVMQDSILSPVQATVAAQGIRDDADTRALIYELSGAAGFALLGLGGSTILGVVQRSFARNNET